MFNLKEQLIKEYGIDVTNRICDGFNTERKITIRINTLKTSIDEVVSFFDDNKIEYEKVSFIDNALILKNISLEEVKNAKIYNEGKIYLQSLSSQLPPLFMDLKDNEQILDMAAAPGGKTTEMAALANVMITACERNKNRFERLKYNIDKMGAKKINVMQIDARDLNDAFKFDKILLDAPCSGSGTLSSCDLDEGLINKTIKLQEELLKKAIKLVNKDGIIIYSTCSILKEENEEIIKKFLGKELELIPISIDDNLPFLETSIKGTICLYPNDLYEGFFIAKLKKVSE